LLRGGEYEVSSAAVLELVAASDCTAYDCEFVAVASHLGTRLVTMDAKLLKAFPKVTQALNQP
jgi:predicted nucleic acid-binding protein